MTPTNRFTPDPADVGREVIEAATGFRVEAFTLGAEMFVRYRVEGKINFEDPHAAGKTARLVRTMLSALEGNAAKAKAKEEGESFGEDGCDC